MPIFFSGHTDSPFAIMSPPFSHATISHYTSANRPQQLISAKIRIGGQNNKSGKKEVDKITGLIN